MKFRIKTLRKECGYTQEKFANKIGLSQNFIAQIEMGNKMPSERTIKDICRLFNVNEEWLRTGNGEMYKPQTKNQELLSYINLVMKDEDESFRKRFFLAVSKFDEQDWKTFEKFIDNLKAD